MSTNSKSDKSEEEYSFIQEQIMPRTKNTKKKFIRYLCVTIVFGIVFGIVSSVVFNISNHLFQSGKKDQIDEPISLSEGNEQQPVNEQQPTVTQEVPKLDTEDDSNEKLTDHEIAKTYNIESYQKNYTIMKELYDDARFSTVSVISVTDATSWFGIENKERSYGIIIKKEEDSLFVLCNYDNVKDVNKIRIEFYNGKSVGAELMNYDKVTSLAILKVKMKLIKQRTRDMIEQITIGDSYQLTSGNPVLALGSPDGSMNSMLIGYITAPSIDRYITDGKLNLFHTSISEDAYGEGFFVNMQGDLIGIITHKFKEEQDENSMCFLGISKLSPLIEDMLNKRKAAYLGVKVCDLSNDEVSNLQVDFGIYVTDIEAKSPAFMEGLKIGDVITAIDGTSVSSVAALMSTLREKKPGEKMKLTVTRQTKEGYPKLSFEEKSITVELGEYKQ